MTTLAEARQAMADALSGLAWAETVEPAPSRSLLRPKCGWVTVSEISPAAFGGVCNATLTAVLVVGSAADEAASEAAINEVAVAAFNAVTESLPFFDASLEPSSLNFSAGGRDVSLYVLAITLTTEVS